MNNKADLANETVVNYKYFIGQKTSQNGKIFLKKVEYNWRTLTIDSTLSIHLVSDKWPYHGADNKPIRIDQGWLLNEENEIQFLFYDNPLHLWYAKNDENKKYAIEIKPMKAADGLLELKDYTLSHLVNLY